MSNVQSAFTRAFIKALCIASWLRHLLSLAECRRRDLVASEAEQAPGV